MIDESCKTPRENLDDGFNPCRKQVVENGELCQYAHMYDVMNERYDREDETSYLEWAKRSRISQSTPSQSTGGGKVYSQDTNGVEGFISTSETLEPTTNAEIPSSKAVADYVPIPLPISKGGTGGNTPYVTGDLDNSAVFVMHDAPNDRYDAVPMSALTGYLDTHYLPVESKRISSGSDLNEYRTSGNYAVKDNPVAQTIINKPVNLTKAFNVYVFPVLLHNYYIAQRLSTYDGTATYYRYYDSGKKQWTEWTLLYSTDTIRRDTAAAFENHIADVVAYNDLLPTNKLMMNYIDAHSMDTPPNKFYYAVSPFPSGTWEGEMIINVTPVFSVKIGTYTYVIARVYSYKRFNYTGTADNIDLFTSLKPVADYTGVFSDSTRIPLTFKVFGRSNADGTYGLTPKGSAANLSLNNQTVSSVFNLGNFDIESNLKCVFGEGTNTPGVAVSVDCIALMWHSAS